MDWKKAILLVCIVVLLNPIQTSTRSTFSVIPDQNIPEINLTEEQEIRFWRANPRNFHVNESHVFPMVGLTASEDQLTNLGKAWITWTIEINNQKIALFAIYNRGEISNFTRIEGTYNSVYWYGLQDQLFIVTSTTSTTTFHRYSLAGDEFIYNVDEPSFNHNIVFTGGSFRIYYQRSQSQAIYATVVGLNVQFSNTTDIVLDTAPGMALIKQSSEQTILTSVWGEYNITSELSDHVKVGHIQLFNPAVFDLGNNTIYAPTLGNFTLLSNIEDLFFYGLKSSVLIDSNNSLFEFTTTNWIKLASFPKNYIIKDYSIIDIGLYLGTTFSNGLNLITSGPDEDQDNLPDTMEDYYYTYPQNNDSDEDGISDYIEVAYGTDPTINDLHEDYDNDGLTNLEEFELNLDPLAPDSDFGGAIDGWEIEYNFNASDYTDDSLDPDGDGLPNSIESIWGSDPFAIDTDGDDIDDAWEVRYQLDPTNPDNRDLDPDNDGRSNYEEYQDGTDPLFPNPRPLLDNIGNLVIGLIVAGFILSYITIKRLFSKG